MIPPWELVYFNAKVAQAVEAWPSGIRARYLRIVERMQEQGPDLGMPHTRALGGGLFEVRAKAAEGIGRAFYCALIGRRIVILHAITKKSQKTPPAALALARTRMNEVSK
jgi:phage-related protein